MRTPLILTAICALILQGCGGGSSSSVKVTSPNADLTLEPLILNGTAVDQTASPQIVEIDFLFEDGSYSICSGTIVGADSILTAGHCSRLGGVASAVVLTVQGVFNVKSIIAHPGYLEAPELGAIFNDVAIVKVDRPLGLPGLPLIASVPANSGSLLSTYGYGLDSDGNYGTLQSAESVISVVTPNHIFIEPFDGKGGNSCNGDSGGPAVQTAAPLGLAPVVGIVGIVSSGSRDDCGEGDVTLYTNLQNPDVLGFIKSVVPEIVIF